MSTRPLPRHSYSLILCWTLISSGCVSIPLTGDSPVKVLSYDLPNTLDVNLVIRAVEVAFTQTLATKPWIAEGSVPSPLPARPAPFMVGERRVQFDRLGVAAIHEVECPGSLATVHAWVADRAESLGPHRYTGCIQQYAGAYRVHLIDSILVLKSSRGLGGSAEPMLKSRSNLLSRLAQNFLEQVQAPEAREVADSDAEESFPTGQESRENRALGQNSLTREKGPSFPAVSENSPGHAFVRGQGQDVVTFSPLVCLAARYETAAVRTQHGAGHVVQVVEQGSLVAVDESVDAAYFRVKTSEGLAGWVNRSDVRRLPCPIG